MMTMTMMSNPTPPMGGHERPSLRLPTCGWPVARRAVTGSNGLNAVMPLTSGEAR